MKVLTDLTPPPGAKPQTRPVGRVCGGGEGRLLRGGAAEPSPPTCAQDPIKKTSGPKKAPPKKTEKDGVRSRIPSRFCYSSLL